MAVTTTIEPDFDRKLEIVAAGLPREHSNLLEKIPRKDAPIFSSTRDLSINHLSRLILGLE